STNLGKSIAISGSRSTSPASASGSSSGLSQTPTLPRAASASCSDCHSATGTMTGESAGTSASAAASRSSIQPSSTTARPLMSSGIHALLERLDSQPPDGVDKAFVIVPALDVDVDQTGDDVGHFVGRERRPDNLAEGRLLPLVAADRYLVPLLAVLIDAEHADVSDVVVTAGIHAAGNVEVDIADVIQIVEVVEAALYRFGDGNRFRIGERAE